MKTKTRSLIKVTHQGEPRINDGYIVAKSKNIVCIEVDLKSKWCEIDMTIGGHNEPHGMYISATQESTSLNTKAPIGEPTKIQINGFDDWKIFSRSISRYTIKICFLRK